MTTDLSEFWIERGKDYINEERLKHPSMIAREDQLVAVVKGLEPKTIVELGCGFGRVTRRILDAIPDVSIIGIDLSIDQITNAANVVCNDPRARFYRRDVMRMPDFPECDVAVAAEFFLHLPEDPLRDLIPRIMKSAKVLVHDYDVDWLDSGGSAHIFNHDYNKIWNDLGLRAQTHVVGDYGIAILRNA